MYLDRGISTKPRPSIPSWIPSFLSEEAQKQRSNRLRQDLKKGYFHDIHEFHRTKGKLFHANTFITPLSESIKLPETIYGRTIYGKNVNICNQINKFKPTATLLSISHNRLAYEHVSSFIKPFMNEFNGSNFDCYELIVLEKWILYSLLFPWIWTSNWLSTSHDRIPFKLFKYGSLNSQLLSMGNISNKLVGYIWLLDNQGRIRWVATGNATDQELSTMRKIVQQL